MNSGAPETGGATTCPPEIAAIIAEILTLGLLSIRNGERSCELMKIEADHLHNLPEMLTDYAPSRLLYYWDIERICYLRNTVPDQSCPWFAMPWERLEFCVATVRDKLKQATPTQP